MFMACRFTYVTVQSLFSILSGPGVAVDLMSMPYPALEEEEEEEEDFTSSAD